MMNIASVFMDGNLVADPEVKTVKNGKNVTTFRLAVNHEWGHREGNKHVSYFAVECWDKLAENCGNYLKKGDHVTLIGDLRQDRWQDGEGETQSTVKVVARTVRFDRVGKSRDKEPAPEHAAA